VSPSIYIASGVVFVASLAIVALGTLYKWDFASHAYNRWTRVTGAVAVVALAAAVAWGRIDHPLIALGILVGGAALAAAFVWVHRGLSARVERELGAAGE
jgi:uncharacterized membrane protein